MFTYHSWNGNIPIHWPSNSSPFFCPTYGKKNNSLNVFFHRIHCMLCKYPCALPQEAVLGPVHVSGSKDDGVGELLPHSVLSRGLRPQEGRPRLHVDGLRRVRRVQRREVNQLLYAALLRGPGDVTGTVHVDVLVTEVPVGKKKGNRVSD